MDILSKIPFLHTDDEAEVAEIDEAQAKADRIAFHRTNVRNGPTNFKVQTNGQAKRARRRALASQTKKARRAQLRNFHQTQHLAAVVRGQLAMAGALPAYMHSSPIDPVKQVKATAWIVQRFGADEIPNYRAEYVRASLNSALKFFGQAVGVPGLVLPDDYVLPIYEIED